MNLEPTQDKSPATFERGIAETTTQALSIAGLTPRPTALKLDIEVIVNPENFDDFDLSAILDDLRRFAQAEVRNASATEPF